MSNHEVSSKLPENLLGTNVVRVLDELHNYADVKDGEVLRGLVASDYDWWGSSPAENALACRDAPLAVTREAGLFLYALVRATSARHVVEFGTSFGISTIYLAAALRDNGGGLVVSTEIESSKVARARENIAKASLTNYADVIEGDARTTLANRHAVIDLLFLDGWKDLYLQVLRISLANLRKGAVVLADDLVLEPEDVADYLNFVRDPANGFVSVTLPVSEGREFSVKT